MPFPFRVSGYQGVTCGGLSRTEAERPSAGMAKVVDARDLKSCGGNPVRVRVPVPALRERSEVDTAATRTSMTLRIRIAGPHDAEAIAGIYAPAVADRATSFELTPPDPEEMRRRIINVLQRFPWLVCESSDGVLGYVYAAAHRERAAYRWSVDVAAYVSAQAQRRGIARALYTGLFELLSLQGYRNAYAGITLPNPASVAMHQAMGFEGVGIYHQVGYKFGQWHDVAWFQRALAPHVVEPPEPTALPALAASAEVAAACARAERLLEPR